MHLISIVTRCETSEAFQDLFRRYIDPDDQALFIAAPEPREVGVKAPFQIRLRDGSIIMRGDAEVVRRWTGLGEDCPWARPGYCIKLLNLEEDSQALYQELIQRSKSVAAIARQAVPPVFAEAPVRRSVEMAVAAEPKADPETILADVAPEAPPAPPPAPAVLVPEVPRTERTDPLWGYLPPPPPPRPRVVELVRRSRNAQIVVGVIGGVLVGALLALLTQGGDEEQVVLSPAVREPPAAPPAAPAPRDPAPAVVADPAPTAPAASPEPEKEDGQGRRRLVYLVLRSRPPGATFFIDGKKVGKAPLEVKVKSGRKMKISAKLDGYAEWTDNVQVKDRDRRVSARLQKSAGRFPPRRK